MEQFLRFFTTGIPSVVLYTSFFLTCLLIVVGMFARWIRNKKSYTLWVLLVEYLFIVVCSTIICRQSVPYTFDRLELSPFWTYKCVIAHIPGVSVWDIVLNVVLFVPLGFLVKMIYPSIRALKMLGIAVLCSLFIETNQYVFEKGVTQIDDMMHNTTGAMIGWYMASLIVRK